MAEFDSFRDRVDAGRQLARRLSAYEHAPNAIVLGLPRGGVPVAFEVAQALGLPLDVLLVRKLGVPGHEEYAMGAIASGGLRVISEDVLRALHIPESAVEAAAARETAVIAEREQRYRAGHPPPDLHGRTVIVVDDGLATGSTMRAAVQLLKSQHPARIVVAVPVGARDACDLVGAEVDEIVCLLSPILFRAVGQWYQHFGQTSDDEVQELLLRARHPDTAAAARSRGMAAHFKR